MRGWLAVLTPHTPCRLCEHRGSSRSSHGRSKCCALRKRHCVIDLASWCRSRVQGARGDLHERWSQACVRRAVATAAHGHRGGHDANEPFPQCLVDRLSQRPPAANGVETSVARPDGLPARRSRRANPHHHLFEPRDSGPEEQTKLDHETHGGRRVFCLQHASPTLAACSERAVMRQMSEHKEAVEPQHQFSYEHRLRLIG